MSLKNKHRESLHDKTLTREVVIYRASAKNFELQLANIYVCCNGMSSKLFYGYLDGLRLGDLFTNCVVRFNSSRNQTPYRT